MANRLRTAIKEKGWSQAEFSRKTGISQSALSGLLNLHKSPTAITLKMISMSSGINLNWLVTGKGQMFLSDLSDSIINAEKLFAIDAKKFETNIDVPPSPFAGLTEEQLQKLLYSIEEKLKGIEQRIEMLESKK